MYTYLLTYLLTYSLTHLLTYLLACLLACLLTYLLTYLLTHTHTHIHVYPQWPAWTKARINISAQYIPQTDVLGTSEEWAHTHAPSPPLPSPAHEAQLQSSEETRTLHSRERPPSPTSSRSRPWQDLGCRSRRLRPRQPRPGLAFSPGFFCLSLGTGRCEPRLLRRQVLVGFGRFGTVLARGVA